MLRWWWCCPAQKLEEDNRRVAERWITCSSWDSDYTVGLLTELATLLTYECWKVKNLNSQGLGATVSSLFTAMSPSRMFSILISAPCPPHPFPLTLEFPPALLQPHQCWWSIWWAQLGLGGSTEDFGHVLALCCLDRGFQQGLFVWLARRNLLPCQRIGCVRHVVGLFPQVVVTAHLSVRI